PGNGNAVYTTSSLGVGHHAIAASFSGGGNVQASTSAALDQVIRPASTMSLKTLAGPAAYGHTGTLTATVAPTATSGSAPPAGTVTFKDGATILGTATLQNGVATLSTSKLSVGVHPLSAVYAGNTLFIGSNARLYLTVRAAATSTSLQSPAVTP